MDNQHNAVSAGPQPAPKGNRFLAYICKLCPFCIAARMFPRSKYAAFMKKAEADCPACKAYRDVYGAS